MRIAISGTHYSGKTSLVEALMKALPKYEFYEEPYRLLEDEGYEFSHPPSLDDFEHQIDYSLNLIEESSTNAVFDRSPVDLLAYALVQAEDEGKEFDSDHFLEKIEDKLDSLDLIVFLGIESPDRIPLPKSEDREFRSAVDDKIREILTQNSLGIVSNIDVLELHGPLNKRISELLKIIN